MAATTKEGEMRAGDVEERPKNGCGFDVCGVKFISHRYRFIYFEVPKTGTSSLKRLLTEHTDLTQMTTLHAFLKYPDYRRFAFVRNPWDRLLSCYLDKIKPDANFENQHFQHGIPKKFHKYGVFRARMGFDEFVHAVAAIPDKFADGHFASQYRRLILEGEIVIDHLARFENFREETNRFLKAIGLDEQIEVPHLRKTARPKSLAQYYNAETVRAVEKRYSEDIRLFGYEFDPAETPVQ